MANSLIRAIPRFVTCFVLVSAAHAGDAEKKAVLDAASGAFNTAPLGGPQDVSWWAACAEGSSVTVKSRYKDPKQARESEAVYKLVGRDKDGGAEVAVEVDGKKTGAIPPRRKSSDMDGDRPRMDVTETEVEGTSKLTIDGKELTCREFERTTTVHDAPGSKGGVYRVHAWSCDSSGVPGGVVKAVSGEVRDQGNGKTNFSEEQEMLVKVLPRRVKVGGTEVLAWDVAITFRAENLNNRVWMSSAMTRSDQVPSGVVKLVVQNHGSFDGAPEVENTTEITSFSPAAGKSDKK